MPFSGIVGSKVSCHNADIVSDLGPPLVFEFVPVFKNLQPHMPRQFLRFVCISDIVKGKGIDKSAVISIQFFHCSVALSFHSSSLVYILILSFYHFVTPCIKIFLSGINRRITESSFNLSAVGDIL